MADRYGKQLVEDVEYRQARVKKVGLGFEVPPSLLGYVVTKCGKRSSSLKVYPMKIE